MLAAKRSYRLETPAAVSTTTMTTSQTVLKRSYEDSDAVREPSASKRRQQIEAVETVQINGSEDTFDLTHQEVLLLHAPKQRYQHTERHQIPQPKDKREMLVKVQVVGLNPIDWKAP
jgi:hypothetical protein